MLCVGAAVSVLLYLCFDHGCSSGLWVEARDTAVAPGLVQNLCRTAEASAAAAAAHCSPVQVALFGLGLGEFGQLGGYEGPKPWGPRLTS